MFRYSDRTDLGEIVTRLQSLGPDALGASAVGLVEVVGNHLSRPAITNDLPAVDPDRAIAELSDRREGVGDEEHGSPRVAELLHTSETAPLKFSVADGEHLVDEQDLRLEVGRHGEGEADVHAARIALHRRVDEPLDAGELDDLVEAPLDLAALHAEDRAVQVDVLTAGELLVETGADLEQAADATANLGPACRRRSDPGEDLQQRRLSCAVAADDAEDLSLRHLERDVAERPDLRFADVVLRRVSLLPVCTRVSRNVP